MKQQLTISNVVPNNATIDNAVPVFFKIAPTQLVLTAGAITYNESGESYNFGGDGLYGGAYGPGSGEPPTNLEVLDL